MAVLTVADIVPAGSAVTLTAADVAGDRFVADNTGRHFFDVNNASGGSVNVTITAKQTSGRDPNAGAITIGNIVVAVGAGARFLIGPIAPAYIGADGFVDVTYSAVTSVTVRPRRLPPV